jgi:hypothetical protein
VTTWAHAPGHSQPSAASDCATRTNPRVVVISLCAPLPARRAGRQHRPCDNVAPRAPCALVRYSQTARPPQSWARHLPLVAGTPPTTELAAAHPPAPCHLRVAAPCATPVPCTRAASYLAGRDARPPTCACMSAPRLLPSRRLASPLRACATRRPPGSHARRRNVPILFQ